MSNVPIESGPASRRTLVLCIILGLSVAVHRCVIGLDPASASAIDQLASAPERGPATPITPATSAPVHDAAPGVDQTAPSPAVPDGTPVKREPRLNPYARRLWTMDPFRSPNMLRRTEPPLAVPEGVRPLLNETQTRVVSARTTVEHEPLANGGQRVSITMPGAATADPVLPLPASTRDAEPVALAAAPALRHPAASERVSSRARPRAEALKNHLSASIFAFAGHDLTREESRRWTLALAFENHGD